MGDESAVGRRFAFFAGSYCLEDSKDGQTDAYVSIQYPVPNEHKSTMTLMMIDAGNGSNIMERTHL